MRSRRPSPVVASLLFGAFLALAPALRAMDTARMAELI